jgi:parallel beta-helix repeat protein
MKMRPLSRSVLAKFHSRGRYAVRGKLILAGVLALGLLLALALLTQSSGLATARSQGTVRYVAPGANCGSGVSPCHADVQTAVDAAANGDEIRVAAGTYAGVSARSSVTQVVYLSKAITIRGGYTTTNWTIANPTANPTTLDAQGQGRVVYITGNITPTLEGLRLTNGSTSNYGSGVYARHAHPVISACQIYSNVAVGGGGIYLLGSANAMLTHNQIYSNTSNEPKVGGGVLVNQSDNVMLSANQVFSNTAGAGGGISIVGSANARLTGNQVFSNTRDGVYLYLSANATLTGNQVSRNLGSGVYLSKSPTATLMGNHILNNTARYSGGGVLLISSANTTFINTIVADNQSGNHGSGLYIAHSSARLLHSTIARNTGGDRCGVYIINDESNYSTAALTNTILVSQTVGIMVTAGNTVTLNGVLWYSDTTNYGGPGVITVTHAITADPAFAADGYHLSAGSAAIDAGVDAGVTIDIDGDSRPAPAGTHPDLGADEIAQRYIYLPLVLR